jgi:hypothetical protein
MVMVWCVWLSGFFALISYCFNSYFIAFHEFLAYFGLTFVGFMVCADHRSAIYGLPLFLSFCGTWFFWGIDFVCVSLQILNFCLLILLYMVH